MPWHVRIANLTIYVHAYTTCWLILTMNHMFRDCTITN